MADTLVERVTGQAVAAAVPVEVQVVMTDRALLAGDDEPATIPGYGTVPAAWARLLVHERTNGAGCAAGTADEPVLVWLRRLFTAPSTGQLVALDSRRRSVPAGLARFIDLRDQGCRTPCCDAPVRHHDHVVAHADGGPTTAANLKGTCEACNYAKQAPGWRDHPLTTGEQRAGPAEQQRAGPDPGHLVQTTTPTGHRYTSAAPALPGHHAPTPQAPNPAANHSPIERLLLDLYWAA
ncbi:HNH endonuclease [Georgenia yuyongxinii]|uniref:HNH endonuclease n=1 Tax=Georgenia yuyongxinii TaxID=2589797 RepID=UPI001E297DA5|nr:HNH endonuclease signature motif containing protein [Georgenia yuyongxinii]